jgi:hypothetical protein
VDLGGAAEGGLASGANLRVWYANSLRAKDPNAALAEYLAFINDHPASPRIAEVLRSAVQCLPDPAAKVEMLRGFLTRYPASAAAPALYLLLGLTVAEAGDYVGAIDAFGHAYRLSPEGGEAAMAMDLEVNDWTRARRRFGREKPGSASGTKPRWPTTWRRRCQREWTTPSGCWWRGRRCRGG